MNRLFVGANKSEIVRDLPPTFLFVDDGPLLDTLTLPKRTKVTRIDLFNDSFNPLADIDYRKARELASVLYAATPGGENTLTVRNGRRALTKLFLTKPAALDRMHFDKSDAEQEAKGLIEDILLSPVLKRFLCNPANHTSFSLDGIVLVRLDRSELSDFEAFILGNLLISAYQGQIVVPDFGFYACPFHTSLIRQDRLIAGVNFLDEAPPMRNALLRIMDKQARTCTAEDAETLAGFSNHARGTKGYSSFIAESVA